MQEFGKTKASPHSSCLGTETSVFLPPGTSTLTLPCLAATTALKGEEVGVIAIAAQAEVGPPDSISLVSVQDELCLCQLHNPRSQLVTFIIHVRYLQRPQSSHQETQCIGIEKKPTHEDAVIPMDSPFIYWDAFFSAESMNSLLAEGAKLAALETVCLAVQLMCLSTDTGTQPWAIKGFSPVPHFLAQAESKCRGNFYLLQIQTYLQQRLLKERKKNPTNQNSNLFANLIKWKTSLQQQRVFFLSCLESKLCWALLVVSAVTDSLVGIKVQYLP